MRRTLNGSQQATVYLRIVEKDLPRLDDPLLESIGYLCRAIIDERRNTEKCGGACLQSDSEPDGTGHER
jgi:hypothetical protein